MLLLGLMMVNFMCPLSWDMVPRYVVRPHSGWLSERVLSDEMNIETGGLG